jgi:hypothetical protein
MICARCPLSLVCFASIIRVSHCDVCQRVILTLPPRVEQKGTYQVDPDRDEFKLVSLPKIVIDYAVACCDDLDMLPPSRARGLGAGCPICDANNSGYDEYRRL